MDEKDEAQMDEAVRALLKDPVMVKEVAKMRDRGMSETYVQNWLAPPDRGAESDGKEIRKAEGMKCSFRFFSCGRGILTDSL